MSVLSKAQTTNITIEGTILKPDNSLFTYLTLKYNVTFTTSIETINYFNLTSCAPDSSTYRLCMDVDNALLAQNPKMTVEPVLVDDPLNGVSTLDLVRMMRHILGIDPFTEAYQVISADLNQNNVMSSLDLVIGRRLILGITTDFPGLPWKFIEKGTYDAIQILETSIMNLSTPPIQFEAGITSYTDVDFVVTKTGDVNLTYISN